MKNYTPFKHLPSWLTPDYDKWRAVNPNKPLCPFFGIHIFQGFQARKFQGLPIVFILRSLPLTPQQFDILAIMADETYEKYGNELVCQKLEVTEGSVKKQQQRIRKMVRSWLENPLQFAFEDDTFTIKLQDAMDNLVREPTVVKYGDMFPCQKLTDGRVIPLLEEESDLFGTETVPLDPEMIQRLGISGITGKGFSTGAILKFIADEIRRITAMIRQPIVFIGDIKETEDETKREDPYGSHTFSTGYWKQDKQSLIKELKTGKKTEGITVESASKGDDWGQTQWTYPQIETGADAEHHTALAVWGRLTEKINRGERLTTDEKKDFKDAERRLKRDSEGDLAYSPTGQDEASYYKRKKEQGLFDTLPEDYEGEREVWEVTADPADLQNTVPGPVYITIHSMPRIPRKFFDRGEAGPEDFRYLRKKWERSTWHQGSDNPKDWIASWLRGVSLGCLNQAKSRWYTSPEYGTSLWKVPIPDSFYQADGSDFQIWGEGDANFFNLGALAIEEWCYRFGPFAEPENPPSWEKSQIIYAKTVESETMQRNQGRQKAIGLDNENLRFKPHRRLTP